MTKNKSALAKELKATAEAAGSHDVGEWLVANAMAERINGYSAAMKTPDQWHYVLQGIGDIARKHGMSDLAKQTGKSRPALYRTLSVNGAPSFEAVSRILWGMGLRLTVATDGKIPPRLTRERWGDRSMGRRKA